MHYWHHAAVARNASIVLLLMPDSADFVSSVSVLTSRTAGYVTRLSGGVGGGSREATPYPFRHILNSILIVPLSINVGYL